MKALKASLRIVGVTTLLTVFVVSPATGQSHKLSRAEQQFRDSIAVKLAESHAVLKQTHAKHGSDAVYTESEQAYRYAIADFEDYQGGNTRIDHQRLEDDANEVWFDLAPLRDIANVAIGSDPRPY